MPTPALLRVILLVLFTSVIFPVFGSLAAERQPFPRIDQAGKDKSFADFREKLHTAVRERKSDAVYGALSPEFFYSFPPHRGIEGFKAELKLEDRNSPYWGVLDSMLALGGGFIREGLFAAPYVPFAWPVELDAESFVAVTDRDAPVREAAADNAKVLCTLSWEIVRLLDPWNRHGGWVRVAAPDGAAGFLAKRYCRGAVDWRAGFEKVGGEWKIKFLLGRD